MKKGILLLMFGVIGMGYTFGQQIMFQNGYYGLNNNASAQSIRQTSDTGYLIFCGGLNDAYFIKTDSLGAIRWTKGISWGNGQQFTSIEQASDTACIGLGNDGYMGIFMAKINSNADTVWTGTNSGNYYDDVIPTLAKHTFDGGGVFLSWDTYGTYMHITLDKLDGNGNFNWNSQAYCGYYTYSETQGSFIGETLDSGYIVIGSDEYYGLFLLRIDKHGSFKWANTYTGNGFNMNFGSAISTTDGGITVLGTTNTNPSLYLLKTDSLGNVIFSKTFGLPVNQVAEVLKQTTDGGFIIAGFETYNQNNNAFVIKTDGVGNILWSKTFVGNGSSVAFDVQQTYDGGFIILGGTSSNNQNSGLIYLIKTDSVGNSGCNEHSSAIIDSTVITSAASLQINYYNATENGHSTPYNIDSLLTESGGSKINLCVACDTPAAPGQISGNTYVCIGSTQTYTIDTVTGATSYMWTIPGNWTGTSTSTSITVQVDTPGGNILVYSVNSCSNSTSASVLAVSVAVLPNQPSGIMGDTSFCGAINTNYSIMPVAGTTGYTWTLPSGWSGSSTTTSIEVTTAIGSGIITVTADNVCGSSPPDSLVVTVNALPDVTFTPSDTIVCVDSPPYILTGGSPLNGVYSGTGVSNGIFDPSVTLSGAVIITYTYTDSLGCTDSAIENVTGFICEGINGVSAGGGIGIYPNPNAGIFTFGQLGIRNYELGIMDVTGRVVYSQMIYSNKGNETISLQLSDGVYFWEMRTGDGIAGKGKLVINRN